MNNEVTMHEGENYEAYQINEQKEGSAISVFADVSDYIDPEDSGVDMLKCDAFYEE